MTTIKKDPKRVAAAKKAARTRKRNEAAAGKVETTTTRRTTRKTYKPKGFLSEAFNENKAQKAFTAVASGGIGYYMGDMASQLMPSYEPMKRAFILGAAGFVSAMWLNMPNLAAGLGGAAARQIKEAQTTTAAARQFMSENKISQAALAEAEYFDALPEIIIPDQGMSENIYGGIPFHY